MDNAGHTPNVSWSLILAFLTKTHYSPRIVLAIPSLLVLPLIYVNITSRSKWWHLLRSYGSYCRWRVSSTFYYNIEAYAQLFQTFCIDASPQNRSVLPDSIDMQSGCDSLGLVEDEKPCSCNGVVSLWGSEQFPTFVWNLFNSSWSLFLVNMDGIRSLAMCVNVTLEVRSILLSNFYL